MSYNLVNAGQESWLFKIELEENQFILNYKIFIDIIYINEKVLLTQ